MIIDSQEKLIKYLPAFVREAAGGRSIYNRLETDLQMAEDWAASIFMAPDESGKYILSDIGVDVHNLMARVVAFEALRNGIPSLDVVIHPNGIGTVQTDQIAPASRQRVDYLVSAMRQRRDLAINEITMQLVHSPEWRATPQADKFMSSLFFYPAMLAEYTGSVTMEFDRYLEMTAKCAEAERRMAEEWVSEEQMQVIRDMALPGAHGMNARDLMVFRHVVRVIRFADIKFCHMEEIPRRTMEDLVEKFKQYPTLFEQWHLSDVGNRILDTPVFRNDKKSSGYFF